MEKVPRGPPLRTALLPGADTFKEQVPAVTFKLLQSLDNRWCGLERDEGQDLDSDPQVSTVDSRPSMSLRLSIVP